VILRAAFLLLSLTIVGGCARPPQFDPAPPVDPAAAQALPPMRTFEPRQAAPAARSNTEIARDFVDLTLALENGARLPRFTRFDEPVTVALTGAVTPVFDAELDRLIARIRTEARIDIRRSERPETAAITVEAIRRGDLARAVPTAACFVLPKRVRWDDFRSNMRRGDLNWTDLTRRDAATVFVPADIAPQEIRDCLHEEIAQALGPVNDLYRLDDSIFNDDNMHSVLTGFDMLILRAAYDDALANGMSRETVAAALPGILARINAEGARYPTRPYRPTPEEWKEAVNIALSPDRPMALRRRAALDALDIAQTEGWQDTRLGLSLLTTGRLASGADGRLALETFLKAGEVYGARDATQIHAANVGIQIAAFALAAGDLDAARRIADRHIPAARAAENAALLSDLMLVKAAALEAQGDSAAAMQARRDGYGWGRYGVRSDAALLRRAA